MDSVMHVPNGYIEYILYTAGKTGPNINSIFNVEIYSNNKDTSRLKKLILEFNRPKFTLSRFIQDENYTCFVMRIEKFAMLVDNGCVLNEDDFINNAWVIENLTEIKRPDLVPIFFDANTCDESTLTDILRNLFPYPKMFVYVLMLSKQQISIASILKEYKRMITIKSQRLWRLDKTQKLFHKLFSMTENPDMTLEDIDDFFDFMKEASKK